MPFKLIMTAAHCKRLAGNAAGIKEPGPEVCVEGSGAVPALAREHTAANNAWRRSTRCVDFPHHYWPP